MKVQIQWNPEKPTLVEGMIGKDLWIICEGCDEPITEISGGMVVLDPYDNLPAATGAHCFHKQSCDPNTPRWSELQGFLAQLPRTSGESSPFPFPPGETVD